ncbi:uncharacterized protein [Zea mays]|uniref:Stellacyanin n=1 Tax=Zea mays TaxID=4577 RepID=B4G1Y9_MAIZE|nr:uncharacterized protein LOC100277251 isoform 2 [Zea mays]XP_008658422.1 uncharacterized protein LOC100277251 isoform X1 [Zea mays]ACF88382.1 unknown [Zea mays]AQL08803.1 Stellacyanin [Zea mays]AQL08808.1 Stellacyanin [Zea mays]AQL08809.1 Stellacyanin [Zea mays]AQL08810.1 Stellacyanin [Zea mays]|eukprot:XP_008658421.1 stellacyanin isoform X1 [Zea mays]
METSAATPTRPPHQAATSPSPSPSSSLRLWRPAAQRNMRNQWSHLSAAKEQWLAAVADGRAHASALVNVHLSCRNMPAMDLGVLKDMPGIRDKANSKLALREEQYSGMLLSAYKEMVCQLSYLVEASHSMRCFSKAAPNCSITQFSDRQDNLNDSGDGGGAPVFKWFSVLEFESLAQELVQMFVSEQKLKRLLLLEFLSIALKEGVELQTSLNWGDELYDGESNKLQSIGLQSGDAYSPPENWCAERLGSQRPGNLPLHEVLQVYLTTWHANMNINRSRIGEIFELVEEEMKIKLS